MANTENAKYKKITVIAKDRKFIFFDSSFNITDGDLYIFGDDGFHTFFPCNSFTYVTSLNNNDYYATSLMS